MMHSAVWGKCLTGGEGRRQPTPFPRGPCSRIEVYTEFGYEG